MSNGAKVLLKHALARREVNPHVSTTIKVLFVYGNVVYDIIANRYARAHCVGTHKLHVRNICAPYPKMDARGWLVYT